MRANTKVMSEMLTEMVPGKEDASDLELLQVGFEKKNNMLFKSPGCREILKVIRTTVFFSERLKIILGCNH